MKTAQAASQFFATESIPIIIFEFGLNLLLAALLAWVLEFFYVRYGRALSDRRAFARNFMLITTTTMIIISIVKSSLALSLGLVGALSIVRFRAAIKEPEELAYLFLAIAIGLGLGANQRVVTVLGVAVILFLLTVRAIFSRDSSDHNLFARIKSGSGSSLSPERIVELLKKHCSMVKLRRLDCQAEQVEALCLVELENFENLSRLKDELKKEDMEASISFIENQGFV
ncbi:MAG: DUF4956 domain-containing protein [Candidatus Dadabacteria bacterium]|nr:MAG: DUF4956 domain-containing protein [Candidatus Dadabacteria bacterium]